MQEKKDLESFNTKTSDELWDSIGFHKPLGGFWYGFLFRMISLGMGIVFSGIIIGFFYPFPESRGYLNIVSGMVGLFYTVMDLGTNMTIERYIAPTYVSDKRKMVRYIQYFIWYQMFTGLIQVTGVTLYALLALPDTNFLYLGWIFLIFAVHQYPSIQGVFGGVVGALQQFHKSEILGFISGQFFQRFAELGCAYLGKLYGENHPEVGSLMGIAYGTAIGWYVSSCIYYLFSIYFFNQVMHKEGLRVRDCFGVEFSWSMIKEALLFGIKMGIPGLIGSITGFIILFEYITYIPQYTTIVMLADLASSVTGFVNTAPSLPVSTISEAYMNGKKKLTAYYVTAAWRYMGLFHGFLLPIMFSVLLILPRFFENFHMDNYSLAIPFLIPCMLNQILGPYLGMSDNILAGSNHPTFMMIIRLVEEVLKVVFVTLWYVWLQLPTRYGMGVLFWLIPWGLFIPYAIKVFGNYYYIQKNVIPLRFAIIPTLIIPSIAGGLTFILNWVLIEYLFDPIANILSFPIAVIIGAIIFMFLALFVYTPLTGALGGWDTNSIEELGKAAKMSGPSKFLVWPMFKLTQWGASRSKLHNRFAIPFTEASKEIDELIELKRTDKYFRVN